MTGTPLESAFHEAMVGVYEDAKRQAKYNATRFLTMVSQKGGVEAAHQLLRGADVSDGFAALYAAGRLDLTVEALVLRPEFESLFTPTNLRPHAGACRVSAIRRGSCTRRRSDPPARPNRPSCAPADRARPATVR